MNYWLLHGGPDGFSIRGPWTKEKIETEIQMMIDERGEDLMVLPRFADKLPDLEYWPDHIWVVLKGEIVVPKPVEVVRKVAL